MMDIIKYWKNKVVLEDKKVNNFKFIFIFFNFDHYLILEYFLDFVE